MTDQANTAPINPMPPEVLTALQGSITKWEGIVAGTTNDEGARNCPLCKMFAAPPRYCDGCPVQAYSGRSMCADTPYESYLAGKTIANAQAELDFLKSLLPGAAS